MLRTRRFFILFLLVALLLPSLCFAGQNGSGNMGHTVIGQPWWRHEPGECFEGETGPLRMVQVGNLVVAAPAEDWFEDPIPPELAHPDRKYFLLERETGCYFSIAQAECDPGLTARALFKQMVDEGSDLLPQLITTPSGVQAVYTVGLNVPAHSFTLFDGKGSVYVVEHVYTARAYDTIVNIGDVIHARSEDITRWLYLIEE